MGRAEKRELTSRLTALLLHLIKWEYQQALRCPSWRTSVRVRRIRLFSHLRDNPSLKSAPDAIAEAYRIARIEAENEMGIKEEIFPPACPWSFEQLMAEDFWPGEPM